MLCAKSQGSFQDDKRVLAVETASGPRKRVKIAPAQVDAWMKALHMWPQSLDLAVLLCHIC
jgi:hypothetical protein